MTRSTQPGLRFRTRKLAPKNLLAVLREDQIDSEEYKELLDNQYKVETGVEKGEENEYHLQAVLAASRGRGSVEEAAKIVPAPPAEETKDINYDELYSLTFSKSSSYIRFSQTVEECTGCQYDMTSEDDVFLKSYNQKRSPANQCSEDNFERIMEIFEATAALQTPYAAVDNTVVPFDVMESQLKQGMEKNKKALDFAKDIYEYWRTRRQASGNKSIQPSLKFEIHQDSDDADPYVCFRRRDVRQTRKTRARDFQVVDKLKKLRQELEEGRRIAMMAHHREEIKRQHLAVERQIFEMRAKLKDVRQHLGISADDEILVNQKPQKKRPVETPALQRGTGNQIRLPSRSDGRPLEADLASLDDMKAQRELALQAEIEGKILQHQKWNQGHVDMTIEPLIEKTAAHSLGSTFRLATTTQLITPPPSTGSDSSGEQQLEPFDFSRAFSPPAEEPCHVGFRMRFGRNGRRWIDRRGLPNTSAEDEPKSDQWKYDQDSDDDAPEYQMDPFDINALRFRATIPNNMRRLQEASNIAANPNIQLLQNQQNRPSLPPQVSVPTQRPA